MRYVKKIEQVVWALKRANYKLIFPIVFSYSVMPSSSNYITVDQQYINIFIETIVFKKYSKRCNNELDQFGHPVDNNVRFRFSFQLGKRNLPKPRLQVPSDFD